ncbi:hypothetical protein I3843_04G069600 [Carya illinoinensis]|nr:hypothetical protein I3843_04G069600 [Carya illinoinensis]
MITFTVGSTKLETTKKVSWHFNHHRVATQV